MPRAAGSAIGEVCCQLFSVDLSIGVLWHVLHANDLVRKHVGRDFFLYAGQDYRGILWPAFVKKHQIVLFLDIDTSAAFHFLHAVGSSFNFSQFNSIAAAFDLKIPPGNVEQFALLILPDNITGAVNPLRKCAIQRILYKSLAGFLRPRTNVYPALSLFP